MSYHQPPQTEFYGTHADPPPYQQDTQYRGAGEYDDGHEMAIGYGHPSHLIDRPLPNYKPASLRWSYLLFIVTIIGGYIAMTEYAIQRLPQETGKDLISDYEELERHQGAHFKTVAVEERGETVRSFFFFPHLRVESRHVPMGLTGMFIAFYLRRTANNSTGYPGSSRPGDKGRDHFRQSFCRCC